jgi:hypothetical protein
VHQSSTGYVALPSESGDQETTSPSSLTHDLPSSKPHRDVIYTTSRGGSLKVSTDGHNYTYAYGPPGLAGLLHNSFALRAAIFASLGGLLFGYDQGVVANILVMRSFLERWPVGAWEKGLMSAFFTVQRLGVWFHSAAVPWK